MNHLPMDTKDPRHLALERLAASRARMRDHLMAASAPDRGEGGKPSALMQALESIPGVDIVIEAVRGWWAQHPLHLASLVASDAARTVVGPMVRRNPLPMVLGAVAVGGLVFWLKPWRGLLRPALLAGLLPQLASRLVARVPIDSWISAVVAMATQPRPAAPASSSEDAAPTATASEPPAPVPPAEPGASVAREEAAPQPRPPSSTLH